MSGWKKGIELIVMPSNDDVWAVKSAGYKQQFNRGKNPDFH